jgi:hypothetical protein
LGPNVQMSALAHLGHQKDRHGIRRRTHSARSAGLTCDSLLPPDTTARPPVSRIQLLQAKKTCKDRNVRRGESLELLNRDGRSLLEVRGPHLRLKTCDIREFRFRDQPAFQKSYHLSPYVQEDGGISRRRVVGNFDRMWSSWKRSD